MALDDTLMNDTPIFNDRAIEDGFYAYWGERSHDALSMEPAHRAYCKRAYEDVREIADLKARVEELEKGSVLTAEGITLNVKQMAGINGALAESLATEKAARVAVEGQVAELRTALEKISVIINLMFPGSTKTELQAAIDNALASPDTGAAAVLATADRVYDTEQAFADRGNLEDEKGAAGNKRYHEWPEMTDHIRAQTEMLEAVADWRKKRQRKTE